MRWTASLLCAVRGIRECEKQKNDLKPFGVAVAAVFVAVWCGCYSLLCWVSILVLEVSGVVCWVLCAVTVSTVYSCATFETRASVPLDLKRFGVVC